MGCRMDICEIDGRLYNVKKEVSIQDSKHRKTLAEKKNFNQGKRRMNARTSLAQQEESITRIVYVSDIDQQVKIKSYEYEKLFRRMNPPRVVIDNESCKNATMIRLTVKTNMEYFSKLYKSLLTLTLS
ncbi:uncharacterized protein LOC142634928 [Castanea sativa]|uniref:uncharacterized protein LOC142634928 n=1 Tax=Castanea sativa TaxID=21020 RepID=UPI003F64FDB3